MPRVKIDYVASFSSEDSDNPASNLLGWDVSKKRWLCPKGEPSCSVVLQLTRAVKVNAVHVGAHHAALVEVLVGRSETPNEPFQVLVPSCVFMSPAESRRAEPVERVRSFAASQLTAASAERWDRVRLVCSQPYNKHCKYGLNFVHVHSPEAPESATAAAASGAGTVRGADVGAGADAGSSDEEFAPGSLFARHRARLGAGAAADDTGAQIRQASSRALKNISDSATKLVKTPIAKPARSQPAAEPRGGNTEREDTQKESSSDRRRERDTAPKEINRRSPVGGPRERPWSGGSGRGDGDSKRERSRDKVTNDGAACGQSKSILRGVVVALSGYVHPERAELRALALELGARCEPDWSERCTHLICAFPNTPKLKRVRAEAGADAPVATGAWLRACRARGRREPWRRYATDPAQRRDTEPAQRRGEGGDAEYDTDDEIERTLRERKKRRRSRSTSRPRNDDRRDAPRRPSGSRDPADDAARRRNPDDGASGRDERPQENVTEDDGTTDDESNAEPRRESVAASGSLPDVFGGATFAIDESVRRAGGERRLARYVRAYGGLLLRADEADEAGGVDYVLSVGGGGVRPAWLWRCVSAGARLPHDQFLLAG